MKTVAQLGRAMPRRLLAVVLPLLLGLAVAVAVTGSGGPRQAEETAYVAIEPRRLLSSVSVPEDRPRAVVVPEVPSNARGLVLALAATAERTATVSLCSARARSTCRPALEVAGGDEVSAFVHVPWGGRGSAPTAEVRATRGPAVVSLDVVGFVVRDDGGAGSSVREARLPSAVGNEGRSWIRDRRLLRGAEPVLALPEAPAGATAAVLELSVRASGRATARVQVCGGRVGGPVGCDDGGVVSARPGEVRRAVSLVALDGSGSARLRNTAGDASVHADVVAFLVAGSSVGPAGYVLPLERTPLEGDPSLSPDRPRRVVLPEAPPGARGVVLGVTARGGSGSAELAACPGAGADSACLRPAFLTVEPRQRARGQVLVPLATEGGTTVTLHARHGVVQAEVDHEGWVVGVAPFRTGPARGALEGVSGSPGGVEVRGWAIDPVGGGGAQVAVRVDGTTAELAADRTRPDVARIYPEFSGDHGFDALVAAPAGRHEVCVTIMAARPGGERPLGCREVTVLSAARPVVHVPPEQLDATSTGVPAGTPLTRHDGDLVVTVPGTVVDALDVHGFVVVMADDVVIRNSRVRGRAVPSRTALVSNVLGSRNLRVVDSELAPDAPSPHLYGVMGWELTLERVNIHGVVDSVHVFGPNVTVRSSWLHDNVHYPEDPNFGGRPSHDDGIQVQAGHDVLVVGSRVEGAHNSAVQVTQDVGVTQDVRIVDNFLDGGGCTVNVAEKQRGPIVGLVVSGNTFGRGTRLPGCAIIAPPSTDLIATDNRFFDGVPAGVRSGA